MGSRAKRRREHRKKINVNPKKARAKERKRKAPRVASDQLREVWDEKQTMRRNIADAGLLCDANKIEEQQGPVERKVPLTKAREVVGKIEAEAYAERRDRTFMMRDDMVFLAQMISKHGLDEWVAMARDPDNLYQLTPKQIRNLYAKCQKIPSHYNALMMACGLKPLPELPDKNQQEELGSTGDANEAVLDCDLG